MSTRGQIILLETKELDTQTIFNEAIKECQHEPSIYLHGDAYPVISDADPNEAGTFNHIHTAVNLFLSKRYFDTEYLLARITQYVANQRDNEVRQYTQDSPTLAAYFYLVTGIGIVLAKYDAAYFYIVTPSGLYCYEHNGKLIKHKPYDEKTQSQTT